MSQDSITWTNDTRKLRDLTPRKGNPRQIRKANAERLVKSWHKFGQPDVISINPDGTILNGHQRYWVWGAAYGDDFDVAVRVASRPFTEAEWQEYTVYGHEGTVAEWDWEGLANWKDVDIGDLVEWGFSEGKLLGADSFGDDLLPTALPNVDIVGLGDEGKRVIIIFGDGEDEQELFDALGVSAIPGRITYRWSDLVP